MKLAVIGTVIDTIPIAGADRIHQAIVGCGEEGRWSGVVGKDILPGSRVLVFLQDAVLPEHSRWDFMSKHKWRVRMARFKGVPSECVIVSAVGIEANLDDGYDLTEILGVKKHEKPVPQQMAGEAANAFPAFIPKTDETNFQRFEDLESLMDGSDWVATLKLDGTSCTVWNDDEGMHVCSRNYELKEFSDTGKGNVYWQAARKFELERLPQGFALQFEIVGPGIQGNPLQLEELGMAAFTLYSLTEHRRLHFGALVGVCLAHDLPLAPVITFGSGAISEETIRGLADDATYDDGIPAEGLVFRDLGSTWSFKALSLDYKERA